jgi:hypothetical protein
LSETDEGKVDRCKGVVAFEEKAVVVKKIAPSSSSSASSDEEGLDGGTSFVANERDSSHGAVIGGWECLREEERRRWMLRRGA